MNLCVSGKASSNYCPRQQQLSKSQSRHNCDLCKESKRRSLASYIRRKSRLNSCSEIDEVQEEEESEEHNVNNVNVDESETAEKNDVNATKDNQEKSEVKIHRNEWGKRRNDNKN